MDRTSDTTKHTDKFGAGKHGYREAGPGVVPTRIRATDADSWSEEIVRAIEGAGLTPDANDLGQLLLAIKALIGRDQVKACAVGFATGAVGDATPFSFSTAAVANPSLSADTGFSVDLGNDEITVPTTGRYEATLSMLAASALSGPDEVVLELRFDNGDIIGKFVGNVWVSGSDLVPIVGACTFDVADVARKIRLYNESGADVTPASGYASSNRLTVKRLRGATIL